MLFALWQPAALQSPAHQSLSLNSPQGGLVGAQNAHSDILANFCQSRESILLLLWQPLMSELAWATQAVKEIESILAQPTTDISLPGEQQVASTGLEEVRYGVRECYLSCEILPSLCPHLQGREGRHLPRFTYWPPLPSASLTDLCIAHGFTYWTLCCPRPHLLNHVLPKASLTDFCCPLPHL